MRLDALADRLGCILADAAPSTPAARQTVICPGCGATVPAGDKCPECGADPTRDQEQEAGELDPAELARAIAPLHPRVGVRNSNLRADRRKPVGSS